MSDEIVWITANKAKILVENHDITAADQLIIQKVGLGFISYKAANFGPPRGLMDPTNPPRQFWQTLGLDVGRQVNWSTGDFVLNDSLQGPLAAIGVEFSLNDLIEALHLPESAAQPCTLKSPAPLKAKGGRPRKDWWDDLWIEICAQIYLGKLIPDRQVDIEKAMRNWISRSGFDASTSTVRGPASKLWKALQQKDENPPD